MSNRYISGFIAGGLIGAATAIIISSRTENDMKKKMIAGGKSIHPLKQQKQLLRQLQYYNS